MDDTRYLHTSGYDPSKYEPLAPLPNNAGYSIEGMKVMKRKGKRYVEGAFAEVVARDGEKCRRCGKTEHLTLDHIIPVSLLRQLIGQDNESKYEDLENLEILCRRCNLFKANQVDMTNPKSKPLLLKYIEMA